MKHLFNLIKFRISLLLFGVPEDYGKVVVGNAFRGSKDNEASILEVGRNQPRRTNDRDRVHVTVGFGGDGMFDVIRQNVKTGNLK